MVDMNNCLINDILMATSEYLDNEQSSKLKNTLYIKLNSYKIERAKCEIVPYTNKNEQLLREFIQVKKLEGLSDKTLKQYYTCNLKMLDYLQINIDEITTKDLRFYLAQYQTSRQVGKVTLQNMTRYMSSFFNWLADEEYITKSPTRRLKSIKVDKEIKKPFSDEDIEKLKNAADCSRDVALIEFLLSTGCRVSEVVGLNIGDIDFNKNSCVVMGKGNKQREVYLNEVCVHYLRNYLFYNRRVVANTEPLFCSKDKVKARLNKSGIEAAVRRLGVIAGVDKVYPHRFRRTLCQRLIDRGVPIQEVQKILGHAKIETTLIYCQANNEMVKINHKRFS